MTQGQLCCHENFSVRFLTSRSDCSVYPVNVSNECSSHTLRILVIINILCAGDYRGNGSLFNVLEG